MDTWQNKNTADILGPSEHLQRAFSLINKVPTIHRYSKLQRANKELDTVANIVCKYGSWDNALQCTFPNINPLIDYSRLIISKADVISTLNELRKIYSSSQPKIKGDLRKRVRLLFGSWSEGLVEAGIGIKKDELREIYKRSTSDHNTKTVLNITRMETSGGLSVKKKEMLDFDYQHYQYAATLGFPPVPPERYYTERKIAIGRMGASRLQKGETLDDIAKSFFISSNSLKVYINRYLYNVSKLKCEGTEQ